jgi:hypothetical protein
MKQCRNCKLRKVHEQDLRGGWGSVELPGALARKYTHVMQKKTAVKSPLDRMFA